ncbi:hypothetical protein Psyr_1556 [Pseudomonas syringae pv. syringae B728a]|uniref:Uncharacterized protein n=1 Tax=Pseudomonas syringae pv. syringae (strain B728a) TaxID=205918 RepID=Q4ZW68_PSEU2|nr:hypothetical protein Psyr_1556 [Pseudomonas syringae pv. syringae B728a]PYD17506.1 hypothetical protein DND47_07860 [Pseudomonas syringae pv. syringae]
MQTHENTQNMIEVHIRTHRKSLLIDINSPLLLIADSTRSTKKLRRVSPYTSDDYNLFLRLMDNFEAFVTTPHIFTEISSLKMTFMG